MRLIISLSALLISVFVVQTSSGSLGPLDALSGLEIGFTATQIGLLGSAHFIGFFLGCLYSPFIVVRSGHARAFAVMAAISAIAILGHTLADNPVYWMALRVAGGFTVAGSYTVIESWLQAKLDKSNRGTTFSIYRMVDMGGSLVSQLLIAGLEPAHYISYNLLAILGCVALLPLALTQSALPALPKAPSFRPFFVYRLSPLAALGVIVVGITSSSFRMVAPVFGKQSGLAQSEIAIFLATVVVGGLVAQMPAGMLADRINRRSALSLFSVLSIVACGLIVLDLDFAVAGIPFIYLGGFFFGFATFPIYSICAAHASDFAEKEELLAMSASLIFFFALGAVVAPVAAGYMIEVFGPPSMFSLILGAHVLLLGYTGWRWLRRPLTATLRPYNYMPRTTMFVAHLLRRKQAGNNRSDT